MRIAVNIYRYRLPALQVLSLKPEVVKRWSDKLKFYPLLRKKVGDLSSRHVKYR